MVFWRVPFDRRIQAGRVLTIIGPGALLHGLCSTIAVRLENGEWGSRFPLIMKNLYAGSIAPEYAETAREEMLTIRRELSAIAPSSVVWDVGRPKAKPPWGDTVGAHIQDLAHLFVTGTQRNLVDEVLDNLDSQIEFGGPLDVVPFDGRRH